MCVRAHTRMHTWACSSSLLFLPPLLCFYLHYMLLGQNLFLNLEFLTSLIAKVAGELGRSGGGVVV
ncbi:hypothetical protein DAI22_01g028808 [Oryza sativa Japonica Group]|nr:hypothetical protein DAI22_01g028808 [Oryza sativa Japonica Group]